MIGFAKPEDAPAIQDFLDKHWKPDYLLAKDAAFFNWQFQSRHAARVNFVLSRNETGELDGILGFIPSDHHDAAESGRPPFLWLVNWMVRPGAGRPGLGIMLRRYLERNLAHAGLGTIGLNSPTLELYRAFGYVTGEMDHHVLVNPACRQFMLLGDAAMEHADTVAAADPTREAGEIRELAAEEMQARIKPDTTCLAKGGEYYRRRYLEHPVYRYRCLLLSRQQRSLVIFIRRAEANGASCLRMVECVGDFELLMDAEGILRKYIVSEGAEYIDLVAKNVLPEQAGNSWLDARAVAAPNHFEPFERGFKSLLYAYRMQDENITPRLFRGDCDQDAPRRLR